MSEPATSYAKQKSAVEVDIPLDQCPTLDGPHSSVNFHELRCKIGYSYFEISVISTWYWSIFLNTFKS